MTRSPETVEPDNTSMEFTLEQALELAISWHQAGQVEQAEALYVKLLDIAPHDPTIMNFLGLARYQRGYSEEGVEWIQKALALDPDYIDAENNLSNIYVLMGQAELAEPHLRRIIEIRPDFIMAYGNLGIVLKDLKRYDEARDYLFKAIEMAPGTAYLYQNLGNIYQQQQQYPQAVVMYRKALELEPFDPQAYKSLSRTYFIMGEIERCAEILEQWLKFDPENPTALHLHAAYTHSHTPARASDGYIKETFDAFSTSFDAVLKRLDYQAPFLVYQALQNLNPDPETWAILDIGCGTGLCGELIRPLAKQLVGMDLSPKMLERAHVRNVYDDLFEAELTDFLVHSAVKYDVITCVDTFCYFGELTEAIQAAVNALKPGGWFIFTLEKQSDELESDFNLQMHGRYTHAEAYVRNTLINAGLRIHNVETATLRLERNESVSGMVVIAQGPARLAD